MNCIYPCCNKELNYIKNFDLTKHSIKELLDFVEPLWNYPDRFVRHYHSMYLSTGGWSGNEDIVDALHHNFIFWSMYWYKSQRGGHYWFKTDIVVKGKKHKAMNRFI